MYPFATAICNISGNSIGQFKVLLLMDGLNYSEAEATIYTYPLMVGQALINFLILIPKRHPERDTSLVDYRIVSIILPNSLYGSIIGAVANELIPQLVSSIIITIVLTLLSINFVLKLRELIKKSEEKEG